MKFLAVPEIISVKIPGYSKGLGHGGKVNIGLVEKSTQLTGIVFLIHNTQPQHHVRSFTLHSLRENLTKQTVFYLIKGSSVCVSDKR